MALCYVYLIQAGDKKNSPVKIGMSNNYKSRIKTLQTGNHQPLRTLCIIKCDSRAHARRVESTLHEILKTQNILGEWFKITRSNFYKSLNALANDESVDCIEAFDGNFKEQDYNRVNKLEKKIKNLVNDNKDMLVKLTRRKDEALLLRGKLEEMGFNGDINKLTGR